MNKQRQQVLSDAILQIQCMNDCESKNKAYGEQKEENKCTHLKLTIYKEKPHSSA
jgi:hypothetical protein